MHSILQILQSCLAKEQQQKQKKKNDVNFESFWLWLWKKGAAQDTIIDLSENTVFQKVRVSSMEVSNTKISQANLPRESDDTKG